MTYATKERPLIFSPAMAQAAHEGRKTRTRRICMGLNENTAHLRTANGEWWEPLDAAGNVLHRPIECPYGIEDDTLYVRESIGYTTDPRGKVVVAYQGDPDSAYYVLAEDEGEGDFIARSSKTDRSRCLPVARWRPSIHMPRWACRTRLRITGVRVERVQDISSEDIRAEGISDRDELEPDRAAYWKVTQGRFVTLWNSINGPGAWERNDWVWVIEFEKVKVRA